MTPNKWSSVGIAIQSALAAAIPITAVTEAAPGVATYSGATNPTSGDYVAMTAVGMRQIDARVFRIANVLTGPKTFELEGIDTTVFDTFLSGSIQVITFGTNLGTVAGLSASGGDYDFVDITTVHDNQRRQIPGLPAPLSYQFVNLWDVADLGLVALKAASDAQAKRAVRFTFATGAKFVFNGYVGATLVPIGQAQGRVETHATITADGAISVYAT